jgi:hypothetical protein
MNVRMQAIIATVAVPLLGCAAASPPSPRSQEIRSSLYEGRCPVSDNVSKLATRIVDRGCSEEVSKTFAASFVQVAQRRWHPRWVMRSKDPTFSLMGGGGVALRSLWTCRSVTKVS